MISCYIIYKSTAYETEKRFSILFSAKVVTENIMNAINRKRGKCKLIQQGRFTFSPVLCRLRKVHLWFWSPLLLKVAAGISLMHPEKFGGCNNLLLLLDIRDAGDSPQENDSLK